MANDSLTGDARFPTNDNPLWNGRVVYPADEHAPVPIPLSDVMEGSRLHIHPEVRSKNYFDIDLKKDQLVLRAGPFIGLIPLNDRVAINIRPRFPLKNLDRLITLGEHRPVVLAPYRRAYQANEQLLPTLLDAFADALIAAVDEVGIRGLHREYTQRKEDTSFPRGRIILGDTIRRHHARGAVHRAAASWFEHVVDNAPNRCLKYAIFFLANHFARLQPPPQGARRRVAQLNRVYHYFDGVVLDRNRLFLNDLAVQDPMLMPTIRAYYKQALSIAVALIRDRGITFDGRGDAILMASLLLKMDDLFEAYLRAVLHGQLRTIAGHLAVLNGNRAGPGGGLKRLFDEGSNVDATPDVVIQDTTAPQPQCRVLLEVKYKPVQGNPARDDVNQAITYGVSYRAPRVVLVHPPGRPGLNALGRIASIGLYQYGFDLAAENVLDEERRFAEAIHRLATAT